MKTGVESASFAEAPLIRFKALLDSVESQIASGVPDEMTPYFLVLKGCQSVQWVCQRRLNARYSEADSDESTQIITDLRQMRCEIPEQLQPLLIYLINTLDRLQFENSDHEVKRKLANIRRELRQIMNDNLPPDKKVSRHQGPMNLPPQGIYQLL